MLRFNMRLGTVVTLASLAMTTPGSAQGKPEGSRDLDLQVRLARMNASPAPLTAEWAKTSARSNPCAVLRRTDGPTTESDQLQDKHGKQQRPTIWMGVRPG